jgi:hypothetical protein
VLRTEPEAAVMHAHPAVVPLVKCSPLPDTSPLAVTAGVLENQDALPLMSLYVCTPFELN